MGAELGGEEDVAIADLSHPAYGRSDAEMQGDIGLAGPHSPFGFASQPHARILAEDRLVAIVLEEASHFLEYEGAH